MSGVQQDPFAGDWEPGGSGFYEPGGTFPGTLVSQIKLFVTRNEVFPSLFSSGAESRLFTGRFPGEDEP